MWDGKERERERKGDARGGCLNLGEGATRKCVSRSSGKVRRRVEEEGATWKFLRGEERCDAGVPERGSRVGAAREVG